MSNTSEEMARQLAAVQAQLQAIRGNGDRANLPPAAPSGWQPAPPNAALGGWQQAAPPAQSSGGIEGILVPIKLQRPNGSVRVYLSLGPEAASSPEALHAALDQLENAGVPVDAWAPKGGGGGNWNRGGGGNWNRGGGGRW